MRLVIPALIFFESIVEATGSLHRREAPHAYPGIPSTPYGPEWQACKGFHVYSHYYHPILMMGMMGRLQGRESSKYHLVYTLALLRELVSQSDK
jgi:hypothetical protein